VSGIYRSPHVNGRLEGSIMNKIAVFAALALAVPALALAAKPPSPGSPAGNQYHKPAGHAYGFYCQNQSKLHVAGTPGTAFSKCVTAMAKLASGATTSPKAACAAESKKHVAGKPGTPFSLCVSGGAKLLQDKSS
jgi:hypothetical protein